MYTKTDQWQWIELDYYDEETPLTIDLLASVRRRPNKIIYLLAASGTNFRSSFFYNPNGDNLAHFFRERGYLVVGITPREDHLTADDDLSPLASWGLAKHRDDVRRVIKVLRRRLWMRYDLLGHSFSGGTALDYAATYDDWRLDRVMVVDLYSLDPADGDKVPTANTLSHGLSQLIDTGITADPSLGELKGLIMLATAYPHMDSGVSREMVGLPGNFTLGAMLHFWLIHTAPMPGVHTPVTGLPRDWPLVQSTIAGTYQFALDPADDTYSLSFIDNRKLIGVAMNMGSGTLPLALMRDWAAVNAQNGAYTIDWSGIDEEVVWINMGLGYANMAHAADLIRDAGNDDVRVVVTPDYGNGDPLYSHAAAADVWDALVEDLDD